MINRYGISKEQVLDVIKEGEFDNSVIASENLVVAIMTQDWCPQWINMQSWVYDLQIEQDIDVYELVYNKIDNFYDFKDFKENKWKNNTIPYLRFYKGGKLFKETNYISRSNFMSIINEINAG